MIISLPSWLLLKLLINELENQSYTSLPSFFYFVHIVCVCVSISVCVFCYGVFGHLIFCGKMSYNLMVFQDIYLW
jgi:hypothetical protein